MENIEAYCLEQHDTIVVDTDFEYHASPLSILQGCPLEKFMVKKGWEFQIICKLEDIDCYHVIPAKNDYDGHWGKTPMRWNGFTIHMGDVRQYMHKK